MRNEEADRIFCFWRWEYLRRNPNYIEGYNLLAIMLQQCGVKGPFIRFIGETPEESLAKIEFTSWVNSMPIDDLKKAAIVSAWDIIASAFKIRIPLSPNTGPSVEKVLETFVQAFANSRLQGEIGDTRAIDYRQLVSGLVSHNLYTFSLISDVKGTEPYKQSIAERHLRKRSLRFEEQFSEDHPHLKFNLPKIQNDVFKKKGKYFYREGTPGPMVIKDKKLKVAEEKILKSEVDASRLILAVRAREREALRQNKKRIFRDGFYRAIGLYLWELEKKEGSLNAELIRNFKAFIEDIEPGSTDVNEIKGNDHDTIDSILQLDAAYRKRTKGYREPYVYRVDKELKKLVKNTAECIREGDILPILN